LQLDVLIGVYDFERLAPQRVIFEVDLHTDCRPAGLSDNVVDAVNYAQVTDVITKISVASEYQLLEALAEDVATQVLAQFSTVSCIDITIHKPDIMPNDVKVAIAISRTRTAQS
jgi:dihydroneopterin aldolase